MVFISFSTSIIGIFIFKYCSILIFSSFPSSNKLLFLFDTDTDKFLLILSSDITRPNLNLLLNDEDKSSKLYLQNEVPFNICFTSFINDVINL